jgi:methyl-accepting chemotaxis protein
METTVPKPTNGQTAPDYPQMPPTHSSSVAVLEPPEHEYLAIVLRSLETMKNGDFSVRLPVAWTGLPGKIADNFNEIVIANEQMASELRRVGQAVGKEGKTRERIRVKQQRGAWDEMEVSVNTLVEDLLRPTTEVTRAIAAVAQGNLTQTVRLDVDGRPLEGEFLRSANIVNTMIQQLGVFTAEVTRVAREVGTDGKLGGQAMVPGVAGTWKDLTDSVNSMASNLTGQVRNIAEVATAVASGDLAKDYGRRSRRNPPAQRSHQHHGRSAALIRFGSHACCPRSWN